MGGDRRDVDRLSPSALVPMPDTDARPVLVRRPTIRDVARAAGVSHTTVSRYLNASVWVSRETADAVARAVAATGYRANASARSLATGRSATVVFLLAEPPDRLFGDPNHAVLLRATTTALAERDLSLVVMAASTPGERARALDLIVGGQVRGVLLMSAHHGEPVIDDIVRVGVPLVVCGRPMGREGTISSVSVDDRAGARQAVAHLVSLGRRRIATITGPRDVRGAVDRLDGYAEALGAAGIPVRAELIEHGEWGPESGRSAMAALLARGPVDAVFAASDAMAAGAMTALRDAGRSVPGDVAVVGFDDSGLAAGLSPPLTTMRQPFAEIAHEMVRILCDEVQGRVVELLRPALLVVRESSVP